MTTAVLDTTVVVQALIGRDDSASARTLYALWGLRLRESPLKYLCFRYVTEHVGIMARDHLHN